MTLTLDLPTQLEDRLRAVAERHGVAPDSFALHALEAAVLADETPADGPALLRFWQAAGVVGMRPDITDSQLHADALRDEAERREKPAQ
jgi:hypothetical protein